MCFHFSLKDANIVAYLTDRKFSPAPRLKRDQLRQFLSAKDDAHRNRSSYGISRGFISSKKQWTKRIGSAAAQAAMRINELPWHDQPEYLDATIIEETLSRLRSLLCDYFLLGLTIREVMGDEALNAFALHAALSSGHKVLFLITDREAPEEPLNWLDPFPALCPLAEDPGQWPGMLF